MKPQFNRFAPVLLCLTVAQIATGEGPSSMPAQQQASFTQASADFWNLDWQGVDGRTYFIQTSVDLVHWEYQPVMAFGVGLWHSLLGSTSSKYFVRLHYTDDTSVTTLQEAKDADFDHDGLSNIDEITIMGTNPFLFATNGGTIGDGAQDWDGDGISNADEMALGLDPGVNNTAPSAGASTVEYAYDDAHRLIGMTSPVSSETFSPDAEGNLE